MEFWELKGVWAQSYMRGGRSLDNLSTPRVGFCQTPFFCLVELSQKLLWMVCDSMTSQFTKMETLAHFKNIEAVVELGFGILISVYGESDGSSSNFSATMFGEVFFLIQAVLVDLCSWGPSLQSNARTAVCLVIGRHD